MTRRQVLAVALGAAGLGGLLVWGLTADSGVSPPPPLATPSTTVLMTAPVGVIDEDTGGSITVAPVPVWDAAARSETLAAASDVMAAFARPASNEAPQWWSTLGPLMTARARPDFAGIDPVSVPVTRVTGPASLALRSAPSSAYVVKVRVPTDAGSYVIVLTRAQAGSPWLADDVIPPDRQR